MTNKNKTNATIFITTSGDSIDRSTYSVNETYKPVTTIDSNLSVTQFSTRYGGAEEKTKIYTPITRKHDELLRINEKLKKLELYI